MYVAPNRDRMCELFGLEYYAFPPSGMAFPDQGVVFSGLGDPYYPHELTHVVVRDLENGAHPIVSEGVATWLGGSITFDYISLVESYRSSQQAEPIPSFIELFTDDEIPQDDQYILGAVLDRCDRSSSWLGRCAAGADLPNDVRDHAGESAAC